MLIVYCEKCGVRVNEEDFASGKALKVADNKAFCPVCAPEAAKKSARLGTARFPPAGARAKSQPRITPIAAPEAPLAPGPVKPVRKSGLRDWFAGLPRQQQVAWAIAVTGALIFCAALIAVLVRGGPS